MLIVIGAKDKSICCVIRKSHLGFGNCCPWGEILMACIHCWCSILTMTRLVLGFDCCIFVIWLFIRLLILVNYRCHKVILWIFLFPCHPFSSFLKLSIVEEFLMYIYMLSWAYMFRWELYDKLQRLPHCGLLQVKIRLKVKVRHWAYKKKRRWCNLR